MAKKVVAEGSPLEGFDEIKPRRRSALGWVIALVVVALLACGYVILQFSLASKIPSGTTVLGVDIGGKSQDEAVAFLDSSLGKKVAAPRTLSLGDKTTTIEPSKAGLTVDFAATVSGLTEFTLNPSRVVSHFGSNSAVSPVVKVDPVPLAEAMTDAAVKLNTAAVDGTVTVIDAQPASTPAQAGTALDVAGASTVVKDQWLTATDAIVVPGTAVEPVINQTATEAAYAIAQKIALGSVWVEVAKQRAELPAATFANAVKFQAEGGALQPVFDGNQLRTEVLKRTTDLEVKPVDARWKFKNKKPKIVKGKAGLALVPATLATAVASASTSEDRVAAVELAPKEAKVTEAALEAMGIKEKVASVSTPYPYDPQRTGNLARAAELLTGTLVKPGETFSVTDAIGPVEASNGYRASGVVVNGVHTTGMGGGLSQMATTSYNAGFFAGMINVEHRPHTEWFPRYPAGREATLYVGVLDVKWRNDSPYGVLLQSWLAGGRLHVAVWSTEYYKVETTSGPHLNVKSPTTINNPSPGCEPQRAGSPGFSITVSRKVTELESKKTLVNERNSWTYVPTNRIVCTAKTPKPAKEDKKVSSD